MKDVENFEDIQIFVNAFYAKVQQDELLGPVFALRIKATDWPKHLRRMYAFWNAVLFFQPTYKGNPFVKHMALPINNVHFTRWLNLFTNTIDEHFSGEKANNIKLRASKMAALFSTKLTHMRNNPHYKSLM